MSGTVIRPLIEGDYIETPERLFFTVKGIIHPKGHVIAYLRYLPDSNGNRIRGNIRYGRVYDLDITNEYIKKKHPEYIRYLEEKGRMLQLIPFSNISKFYYPELKLKYLLKESRTELEKDIVRFVTALSNESKVSFENIGISGSVLIDLSIESSDIDLIIYGREEGRRVYNSLINLRKNENWIHPYDSQNISKITHIRWKEICIDLKKLYYLEERKLLHGKVYERDYFIRLVPRHHELESEKCSKPLGKIKVRAKIRDADEAIFTPCVYKIKVYDSYPRLNVDITELISFRGKFTEQVEKGMFIEARGTLEKVVYPDRNQYRVVLGVKGDYLLPTKLINENLMFE